MDEQNKNRIYDQFEHLWISNLYPKTISAKLEALLINALKQGYPIDYIPQRSGISLLHKALKGDLYRYGIPNPEEFLPPVVNTVRFMLDHGANVNVTDCGGWNALMYACHYLLQYIPQDIFARIVRETKNLEQIAVSYACTNVAVKIPPQTTALVLAARKYLWQCPNKDKEICWEKIKILIDAGADVGKLNSENVASFTLDSEEERDYKDFMDRIIRYKEQMIQLSNPAQADWDYEL